MVLRFLFKFLPEFHTAKKIGIFVFPFNET